MGIFFKSGAVLPLGVLVGSDLHLAYKFNHFFEKYIESLPRDLILNAK